MLQYQYCSLVWSQLIISQKVLLQFVNDKNDTIGISNQYSANIITHHSGVHCSELSDTYGKIINVHRSLTAMTSHSNTNINTFVGDNNSSK